jgi:hypothetical protein
MNSEEKALPPNFDQEHLQDLETLSGLMYTLKEIAMYFKVTEGWLWRQIKDEESQISYHYQRGRLLTQAKSDIALKQSAEGGNVAAIKLLAERQKETQLANIRKKVLE